MEVEVEVAYESVNATVPARTSTIWCPRRCGWFRSYTRSDTWLRQTVEHPLYGLITESALVTLDVQSHDCTEYRNAYLRLRKAENARI